MCFKRNKQLTKLYYKITTNIYEVLFITAKFHKGTRPCVPSDNCSITHVDSAKSIALVDTTSTANLTDTTDSQNHRPASISVINENKHTTENPALTNDHSAAPETRNGNEAAIEDKPYKDPGVVVKKRCLTVAFAVFAWIIGTLDILTDWYNGLNFTLNFDHIESCYENISEEATNKEGANLKRELITVCILGSMSYILEFISFAFQLHYIRTKKKLHVQVLIFQEITSCITLVVEDLVMVIIILNALVNNACPMLNQMRSLIGTLAITCTTVSVLFRAVQSLATCCAFTGCKLYRDGNNKCHCHVMMACLPFRIFRSIITVTLLVLIICVMTMAYANVIFA